MSDDTQDSDWQDPAEDGATFALKHPPLKTDTSDLEDWAKDPSGWRKIEASVVGGAALGTDAGKARATELVDPNSIINAAQKFVDAIAALEWLESFISNQTHAIAGEHKSWQGKAADAFVTKMDYLAKYVGNQAEALNGGAGMGPDASIVNQLVTDANQLALSQYQIEYIDVQFANIANNDPDLNVNHTSDGLTAISSTKYARPMTDAMLNVAKNLANNYYNTLKTPPVSPPPGTGDVTPPPVDLSSLTTPNLTTPNFTTPNFTTPNFTTPAPSNFTTPNVNNLTTPNLNNFNLTTPSLNGPNGAGGGPNGTGGGNNNIKSPADYTPPADITPPGGAGLPGLGGPNDVTNPVTGPPDVTPPAYTGPGGSSGGGGDVTPPAYEPPGGVGGSDIPPPAYEPPGGLGSPGGVPGPGAGSGSKLGNGSGGANDVTPPAYEPPGGVGGSDVTPPAYQPPGGLGDGVGTPGLGGGPMGMPGSPGSGMGGGGAGQPERPDASGLLNTNPGDWNPTGDLPGVPEAPGGVGAGGGGLKDPLGGGGPMGMPGSPGSGLGGGSSSQAERPDAAGLVGGAPDDWGPAAAGVDLPDAPGGAAAGGAGLDTAGKQLGGNGEGAGAPGEETPMAGMPGSPGSGRGGGTSQAERPDAAGLVAGEPEDWQPVVPGVDMPATTDGVAPGGAGLGDTGMPAQAGEPVPLGGVPGGVGDRDRREKPDAARLVAGDVADWGEDADGAGRPTAPAGTDNGGAGLTGPEPSTADSGPGSVPAAPAAGEVPTSIRPVEGAAVAAVTGTGFALAATRRGASERESVPRPDAAELLEERKPTWTGDDGRVPVVRPADDDDTSGWDESSDAWWLSGDDATPDGRPDDARRD